MNKKAKIFKRIYKILLTGAQQTKRRSGANHFFSFCIVQSGKKFIIGTVVYFSELYYNAGPDIKLARFIFCIGSASNITATTLKLCTQLFL